MDKLDTLIEIIQKANNIQLLKEKIRPVYERMIYYKKEKNQIVSQIGDCGKNLYILLSGVIRLYYIDTAGNDITRFFGTKGCIGGGIEERLPYVVETLWKTVNF